MAAESRDHAGVRFPPPLVFVALVCAGLGVQRWLWPLDLAELLPRIVFEILGSAIIALALVLLGVCLVRFHRDGQRPEPWTPTPTLIIGGPYRFSRNPMYLAMALLQTGIGLVLCNPWILLGVVPALWGVYRLAVRAEEAYLEGKFGAAYREYCQRVGRWL